MNLRKFIKSKLFFGLQILSRLVIFIFGLFLLMDDLFWHNIGVNEIYSIASIHIHHAYVGVLFMFLGGFSIYLLVMERKGKL
jgi:hypothetical protein